MVTLSMAGRTSKRGGTAGAWIGGEQRVLTTKFGVHDPGTGALLAHVSSCGAAEADEAVGHAARALRDWSQVSALERSSILKQWHDLMIRHRVWLGSIITAESGKPVREALSEVDYAAGFVSWFAEQALRINGAIVPSRWEDTRLEIRRRPIGVVAAITPWNFPAAMLTRKAAPALASGCTMVVKPSELTPLTALALGELASLAGVPPGVLNIVTTSAEGAAAVGRVFTESRDVRKLTFTGSTAIGKQLYRQSSSTVKRLSLELGGNAPFLVFGDADIDTVMAACRVAKFRNAGQTCVAANRFLVADSVYDDVVTGFVELCESLTLGSGCGDPDLGPLIDERASRRVSGLVDDSVRAGAVRATPKSTSDNRGSFVPPVVLTEVSSSARVWQEEIFGPVIAVSRFDDEMAAVEFANATDSGLAAYAFSQDLGFASGLSDSLDFGIVGINTGSVSAPEVPFGGIKESGLGREGSVFGIDEYLEYHYLALSGGNQSRLRSRERKERTHEQ